MRPTTRNLGGTSISKNRHEVSANRRTPCLHSPAYSTASRPSRDRRAPPEHDYRKLLDDKKIDAVIAATNGHWHALPTIHACQAGKDVYVEKPLATSIGEEPGGGRAGVKKESFRGAGPRHARVFVEHVRSRTRPPADVETGHYASNPGHLLNIAWRVGKRIEWNAENEKVVNVPEADQFVTREYRARRGSWKCDQRGTTTIHHRRALRTTVLPISRVFLVGPDLGECGTSRRPHQRAAKNENGGPPGKHQRRGQDSNLRYGVTRTPI